MEICLCFGRSNLNLTTICIELVESRVDRVRGQRLQERGPQHENRYEHFG